MDQGAGVDIRRKDRLLTAIPASSIVRARWPAHTIVSRGGEFGRAGLPPSRAASCGLNLYCGSAGASPSHKTSAQIQQSVCPDRAVDGLTRPPGITEAQ